MATILIVDSNETDRSPYISLLGNLGHRMLEAVNGMEALELARAELPDLIITDIILPSMDGFTLVRRLREEPLLMRVPVIFHTANYDESEIHKLARASGVRHILRKPSEPHEILRVVNDSLKRPAATKKLSQTGQLQRKHLEILADKLYQKVAELENTNERLNTLSLTDELTGLNNRRGFIILATSLLRFASQVKYSLSLLYIDVDSLKHINNTFGHAAGDVVIIQFAKILTNTFRNSDIIGRLGGDEFVVLLVDADENDLESMQALLKNNVDTYNLQFSQQSTIAFSLGIIWAQPDSATTMEDLLSQADKAMYEHKRLRKSTT